MIFQVNHAPKVLNGTLAYDTLVKPHVPLAAKNKPLNSNQIRNTVALPPSNGQNMPTSNAPSRGFMAHSSIGSFEVITILAILHEINFRLNFFMTISGTNLFAEIKCINHTNNCCNS